jgi:peptidoglycan/LPS O-acetylase OafA/YrhL
VRRHPAAAVLALWGLLNLVLSTLMFVFTTDAMSHAVYWGANLVVFAMAGVAVLARERPRRLVPEASAGAFALALAVAFMALGAGIGSWAAFVGAAILAVALVLLLVERRA